MARILRETFEDHLLTKALKEDFEHLPSPEELKYKVIIRVRIFLSIHLDRELSMVESSSSKRKNTSGYRIRSK